MLKIVQNRLILCSNFDQLRLIIGTPNSKHDKSRIGNTDSFIENGYFTSSKDHMKLSAVNDEW